MPPCWPALLSMSDCLTRSASRCWKRRLTKRLERSVRYCWGNWTRNLPVCQKISRIWPKNSSHGHLRASNLRVPEGSIVDRRSLHSSNLHNTAVRMCTALPRLPEGPSKVRHQSRRHIMSLHTVVAQSREFGIASVICSRHISVDTS